MAQSPSPRLERGQRCFSAFRCGFAFLISLLLAQVQVFRFAAHAAVISFAQDVSPVRSLEPGTPIERELAGGQSHVYRFMLAPSQYVKLDVDQRGVDVTIKLSGPDGKQILDVDAESTTHGKETVEEVATTAGDYRLVVQPKLKDANAGRYEIRIEELRAATENDRALQEARNLFEQQRELQGRGKYDEALPLIERALKIRETILGLE